MKVCRMSNLVWLHSWLAVVQHWSMAMAAKCQQDVVISCSRCCKLLSELLTAAYAERASILWQASYISFLGIACVPSAGVPRFVHV